MSKNAFLPEKNAWRAREMSWLEEYLQPGLSSKTAGHALRGANLLGQDGKRRSYVLTEVIVYADEIERGRYEDDRVCALDSRLQDGREHLVRESLLALFSMDRIIPRITCVVKYWKRLSGSSLGLVASN